MLRSLYTAASGMQAQQFNLDTIANNLANSSTAGFRRRRLQFQDLLYQNMVMPGQLRPSRHDLGGLRCLGTRPAASESSSKAFHATGNPLDLTSKARDFFRSPARGEIAYTVAEPFIWTRKAMS